MIFAMVVLGGVTRLTGSGLSMVHWKPVTGIFPPQNEQQWSEEFAHYQQSPEYQKINVQMDLEGFKKIYWFEFAHRVLGRTIGLVFLLPFLYFLVRRKIDKPLVPKLVVMFVLGGLQGLLGWYMVKSGLIDNPHVSQYRLTAHLVAAIAIYSYMFWVALGLLYKNNSLDTPEQNRSLPESFRSSLSHVLDIHHGAFWRVCCGDQSGLRLQHVSVNGRAMDAGRSNDA